MLSEVVANINDSSNVLDILWIASTTKRRFSCQLPGTKDSCRPGCQQRVWFSICFNRFLFVRSSKSLVWRTKVPSVQL